MVNAEYMRQVDKKKIDTTDSVKIKQFYEMSQKKEEAVNWFNGNLVSKRKIAFKLK